MPLPFSLTVLVALFILPGNDAFPPAHISPVAGAERHPAFPYNLDEPDLDFEMPASLIEISGLSMTADGRQIVANNDETGSIFLINKLTGKVEQEITFGEEGDYEGLEIVGNDAYIIKSSGTLYRVENYASEERVVSKFKSFLNKENDVEGLAYDSKQHRLLVGCKGKGVDIEGEAPKKAIYAFDLHTFTMIPEPVFLLSLNDVQHYIEHNPSPSDQEKLEEMFSPGSKEMRFNPSGIAVHPLSGDIYITSSTGKMLLVFSPDGKILFLEKLKKTIHTQPEGLCFESDGTLYISNEGKKGPGKIYKFRYRN